MEASEIWAEGFEQALEWMRNNPSPSGESVDPPKNPYEDQQDLALVRDVPALMNTMLVTGWREGYEVGNSDGVGKKREQNPYLNRTPPKVESYGRSLGKGLSLEGQGFVKAPTESERDPERVSSFSFPRTNLSPEGWDSTIGQSPEGSRQFWLDHAELVHSYPDGAAISYYHDHKMVRLQSVEWDGVDIQVPLDWVKKMMEAVESYRGLRKMQVEKLSDGTYVLEGPQTVGEGGTARMEIPEAVALTILDLQKSQTVQVGVVREPL